MLLRRPFTVNPIIRNRFLCRRSLATTAQEVPERFYKILNEVGSQLNLKDHASIRLTQCQKTDSSSVGSELFPSHRVVGISEYLCNPEIGKKELVEMLRRFHKKGRKYDGNALTQLKLVYGVNISEDAEKFIIAHELAHMKMNDAVWESGLFFGWWLCTTSLSCGLWKFLPNFELTHWEQLLSESDFLGQNFVLPIGLLWGVSFYLYKKYSSYLSRRAEFRADRLAGELDLDIAKGGMAYMSALKTYAEALGLDKKQHDSHPDMVERINALKEVVKKHKRPKS